jgi:hypothetical protein
MHGVVQRPACSRPSLGEAAGGTWSLSADIFVRFHFPDGGQALCMLPCECEGLAAAALHAVCIH